MKDNAFPESWSIYIYILIYVYICIYNDLYILYIMIYIYIYADVSWDWGIVDMTSYEFIYVYETIVVAASGNGSQVMNQWTNALGETLLKPCSPVGLLPGFRMPAIFQIDDCAWKETVGNSWPFRGIDGWNMDTLISYIYIPSGYLWLT